MGIQSKGISKGMQVEIDMATKLNIPIKYMEDNKMDKTYKDIWYDIKEELIDIARWTSTVSLPKLIDKMEVYEKLIKMTITENRGLVNENKLVKDYLRRDMVKVVLWKGLELEK